MLDTLNFAVALFAAVAAAVQVYFAARPPEAAPVKKNAESGLGSIVAEALASS